MKFVSKNIKSSYFWVEDFTEKDKEFFIGLGFKEKKPNVTEEVAKAFGFKSTLNFTGSKPCGFWSKKEIGKICKAIYEQYTEIDQIKIEEDLQD